MVDDRVNETSGFDPDKERGMEELLDMDPRKDPELQRAFIKKVTDDEIKPIRVDAGNFFAVWNYDRVISVFDPEEKKEEVVYRRYFVPTINRKEAKDLRFSHGSDIEFIKGQLDSVILRGEAQVDHSFDTYKWAPSLYPELKVKFPGITDWRLISFDFTRNSWFKGADMMVDRLSILYYSGDNSDRIPHLSYFGYLHDTGVDPLRWLLPRNIEAKNEIEYLQTLLRKGPSKVQTGDLEFTVSLAGDKIEVIRSEKGKIVDKVTLPFSIPPELVEQSILDNFPAELRTNPAGAPSEADERWRRQDWLKLFGISIPYRRLDKEQLLKEDT